MRMPESRASAAAPPVQQLIDLFRGRPEWRDAARHLEDGASSNIYFTSEPGSVWHVERRGDDVLLLSGAAHDPDLAFCFTPESVASLAQTHGGVGDFAVRLFHLVVEAGSEAGIELRIVAPFSRLVRRGYLSLLVAGGLRVLAFGAAHGVRTVRELRRLVDRMHLAGAAAWETAAVPAARDVGLPDRRGLRLRIRRAAREIASQHDQLREIAGEISDALDLGDTAGAASIATQFRDALDAHFALEEDVVFPALHGSDPRSGNQIESLLSDHVAISAELRRLIDTSGEVDTVDWRACFYELRRSILVHEAREEGVVSARGSD
jgi:hypothetical protein